MQQTMFKYIVYVYKIIKKSNPSNWVETDHNNSTLEQDIRKYKNHPSYTRNPRWQPYSKLLRIYKVIHFHCVHYHISFNISQKLFSFVSQRSLYHY